MQRFIKTLLAMTVMGAAITAYATATTTAATTPDNTAKTTTMTPEQQAQIEEVVHQYLVRKPEVLVEALQVLQKKQMEQAQQTMKQTEQTAAQFATPLFHTSTDPVAGNPNGKVTIVEFFDYQCPHCVSMSPVMEAVIKANPDVRVIYKDFPIRGPVSEFAARAALAANKQGKYMQFSRALLASNQQLTQDTVLQIAKNAGLNIDQLKKDMNDKSIDDQLKATIKLAQDLKLFGTPAIFIGKTNATDKDTISYVPGEMNQAQLQDMINKLNKS